VRTAALAPDQPVIRLGLRENLSQFILLIVVNAFVGAMVGIERTILPLLAEREFHLVARFAALSFIVVFEVTKALTNYAAGQLSDRIGRKHVLVAWIVAIITFSSGVMVGVRMDETVRRRPA
jgi:nitrate/nitrite transporter NarK